MVDDVLSDLSAVQSVRRLQQEILKQTFLRTGIHLWLSVIFDRSAGTAAVYADFGKNNSDLYSMGLKTSLIQGFMSMALCAICYKPIAAVLNHMERRLQNGKAM